MLKSDDQRFSRLTKALEIVGLDSNWALSVIALCAQEIAIRKKLEDLGTSSGEEDFQKIAGALEETLKQNGQDPPNILLSLARAYPHIRGKLVHSGHKNPLYDADVDSILTNSIGLIETLFRLVPENEGIQLLAEELLTLRENESLLKTAKLDPNQKRGVTLALIEKSSSLDWNVSGSSEKQRRIKETTRSIANSLDPEDTVVLLSAAIDQFGAAAPSLVMELVAATCHVSSVMRFLQKKRYTDWIVSRFVNSKSYDEASVNSKAIARINSVLTKPQIKQILNAISENDQIRDSWGAKDNLKSFIGLHKGKVGRSPSKET